MMIEQHYDEEVLAEFLAEPQDSVSRDKHLADCKLCLRTLDSLRSTARVLTQPAVWNQTDISTTPRPATLTFLRNAQKTMRDEEAAAAVAIKQLLAGPREGWAAKLEAHPEWRTGGMVKRLLKAGDDAVNLVPADAVEITRIAAIVADQLAGYPTTFAQHLRGVAHYDHGYALWFTGAVQEALEALNRASVYFDGLSAAEFDSNRVNVLRAYIDHHFQHDDTALQLATAAATVFGRYEDVDRFAATQAVAAIILQENGRVREALSIHSEVSNAPGVSECWRLSAIQNMAICYGELGDFQRATSCLMEAIGGYERLRMMTSRAKSRWVLAQLFARQERQAEALALYTELRQEFEELGMANDVAFIVLDLSESLLVLGRAPEIGAGCSAAITYFATAGMAETEPALRALAYLREAAQTSRLTRQDIHGVRAFLQSPTKEGERLFLEPPQ